jgi:hypothetical protein
MSVATYYSESFLFLISGIHHRDQRTQRGIAKPKKTKTKAFTTEGTEGTKKSI